MDALNANVEALMKLTPGCAVRYIGRGHRIGLPDCETGTYMGTNPNEPGQALFTDDNGARWGVQPRMLEPMEGWS